MIKALSTIYEKLLPTNKVFLENMNMKEWISMNTKMKESILVAYHLNYLIQYHIQLYLLTLVSMMMSRHCCYYPYYLFPIESWFRTFITVWSSSWIIKLTFKTICYLIRGEDNHMMNAYECSSSLLNIEDRVKKT